jgi:hypothetical protein
MAEFKTIDPKPNSPQIRPLLTVMQRPYSADYDDQEHDPRDDCRPPATKLIPALLDREPHKGHESFAPENSPLRDQRAQLYGV